MYLSAITVCYTCAISRPEEPAGAENEQTAAVAEHSLCKIRSGNVQASTFSYTGQRRDDTGLLYDNARYYDPARGQFLSADSIVPGSPNGGIDGIGIASLATDFSDPMFAAQIVAEQAGALDDKVDRRGPANTQALNRYSYVQNNPLKWTDPTGHALRLTTREAAEMQAFIRETITVLKTAIANSQNTLNVLSAFLSVAPQFQVARLASVLGLDSLRGGDSVISKIIESLGNADDIAFLEQVDGVLDDFIRQRGFSDKESTITIYMVLNEHVFTSPNMPRATGQLNAVYTDGNGSIVHKKISIDNQYLTRVLLRDTNTRDPGGHRNGSN